MPLSGARNEDTSVVDWIRATEARRLRPADIPSPLGRSMAGWGDLRVKVQPEVQTLLDRLLEHRALRGKFQTKGHVGWMLIHLGAAAVYRYLEDNWAEQDDIVHSITYRLAAVQAERARIQEREAVREVVNIQKDNIHSYLEWGTPEGKYRAYKALKAAFEAREYAPNKQRYDELMSGINHEPMRISQSEHIDGERMYDKMVRGLEEDVYHDLTQAYYDELDSEREGR